MESILSILTPEEEEQLKLIKLSRKNASPNHTVKEEITPEEYQKRLKESLRRDKHVHTAAKQERIQKASKEWGKRVGPRFAEANTENPTILERVRRLQESTGVHKTSLVLSGNLGVGKAQPLNEKVLTPNGWRKFGDIKPGEQVITSSGKPTTVRAVHPIKSQTVYTVYFDDGTAVQADGEHLWVTYLGFNKTSILTTNEMLESIHDGHKIPTLTNIEMQGQIQVDMHWESIIKDSLNNNQPLVKDFRINPLVKKIKKQLGLNHTTRKQPSWFLGLTPKTRETIVAALFQHSGTVVDRRTVDIEIVNEGLAEELTHMVRSTGGYAKLIKNSNNYVLQARTSYPIFDKTDSRYRLYAPSPKKEIAKRVTKIEAGEYQKVRCITVASSNNTYITTGYTVTHNTWLAYAYINHAVQKGAVTPGQIIADTETAILGKISSSGFRRAELLEELFHPKYKIYFIDDVGQGYFSTEQSRKEVWYELLDHVYSHDLTLILTTNKDFIHRGGKIVGSPALEKWIGSAAYDRLRHIVGSDGLIIPGNVNKRPGAYEKREENLKNKD